MCVTIGYSRPNKKDTKMAVTDAELRELIRIDGKPANEPPSVMIDQLKQDGCMVVFHGRYYPTAKGRELIKRLETQGRSDD